MSERFANREVCDLIVYDYKSKKPILWCDYANTNSTELTGESVFAYGGQGHPKRVSFTGEKGGTFSFETQIQSFQLYAMISGGTIKKASSSTGGNIDIVKREVVKCSTAGSVTATATPVAGTLNVFAVADDCGTAIAGTLAGSTFTATTASQIAVNSEYVLYYQTAKTSHAQSISIKSTTFPKAVRIVADTYNKSEDDEILPYQLVVYKAQPQTNITLSNSNTGDPVTLTVTCDLMADPDGNMIDLILLDDETPAS